MPTTEYGVDQFFQNAGTSPKMVYDVAGALVWSPHNLLPRSSEMDNAAWGKGNCTITANAAVAPDGTTTADKLVESVSASNAYFINEGTAALAGTYSIYLKAGERTQVALFDVDGGKGDFFDLTAGTIIAGSLTTTGGAAIQSVGSGWYRCSIPILAGSSRVDIYLASGGSHYYAGNGTSGAYVWGAQINKGSVPTAYLPTTTAARIGLALDYDPVTHAAKGLLCEPQGTNLVWQSAAGRAGFLWAGNGSTKTTSAQVDPAGGLEALQVVVTPGTGPGAGLNVFAQTAVTLTIGTTYTASMWVKGTAGQQQWFGMDSNATQAQQTLVTFTGAWQRVSKTFTSTVTTAYIGFECYDRSGGAAHLPAITYHVWGGQYETGTVATSYIPTLAATVTRAVDQYNVTPASINYSATAGSWWVDIQLIVLPGGVPRIIGHTDGATPLYQNALTSFGLFDVSGGGAQIKTVPSTLGLHKVATAFQSADRAITADGLAVVSDALGATSVLTPGTNIYLGQYAASDPILGYIRKVRYLPRRPSNAELQTMTT